MEDSDTELLLQEIAVVLAEDKEYPLDGTLLYARVDDGMVAPSIYKDRSNHILYREPDLRSLGDALDNLWYAQKNDSKWYIIEYLIKDDKFHVSYIYPDEIDPEEEPFDLRDRVIRRYFGDKPIIYPELSSGSSFPNYEY